MVAATTSTKVVPPPIAPSVLRVRVELLEACPIPAYRFNLYHFKLERLASFPGFTYAFLAGKRHGWSIH